MTTVFCTKGKLPVFYEIKKDGFSACLTTLVCLDHIDQAEKDRAETLGLTLLSFTEVMEAGESTDVDPFEKATLETIDRMIYTSGTTGDNKGVLIKQKNYLYNWNNPKGGYPFPVTTISYLNSAHTMDFGLLILALITKGKIGYSTGLHNWFTDCQLLKPNFLPVIPRIAKMIEKRFNEEILSWSEED
jgi:long-subunit acyl-CoA synthetase (AMP-forming)